MMCLLPHWTLLAFTGASVPATKKLFNEIIMGSLVPGKFAGLYPESKSQMFNL